MKSKTGMKADQHSPEMRQRIAVIVYGVSLMMCLMLCFSTGARADGYRLPNQDPEAIARGNAFAASADNPAAIYYNPAGITQIQGQQASAGIYLISTSEKFTSTSGATASVNTDFQPVPQIYYVFSPK